MPFDSEHDDGLFDRMDHRMSCSFHSVQEACNAEVWLDCCDDAVRFESRMRSAFGCDSLKKQRGPANRTPSCVGEPTLLLLLRGLLRCLLGSLLGALLGSFLGRFLRSFLSHGEMGLMPNLASFDHVYATCDANVAHRPLLKSLKRSSGDALAMMMNDDGRDALH